MNKSNSSLQKPLLKETTAVDMEQAYRCDEKDCKGNAVNKCFKCNKLICLKHLLETNINFTSTQKNTYCIKCGEEVKQAVENGKKSYICLMGLLLVALAVSTIYICANDP